ncbi:MipA/OmpV family protein [Mesorhizobium sp. M2E.F.Ca.ET.209.01.1.1]|uniref:MipA/OmpV family protein n=1 Tax=Mesorhizobium sp. M2E.F.Ca.ET.209.01.1.1 TaxID=2500526 RepID=UPI000FD7FA4C|nr:MipA/OmpV family protein [Mesorhizobium sp. M2E.F.Ca.ET.209.01.1.1]TGS14412.1 MipA/OmpV family protein [Mesorhizobium sp. M2E.F.Ca.ET.209.01.1.1]
MPSTKSFSARSRHAAVVTSLSALALLPSKAGAAEPFDNEPGAASPQEANVDQRRYGPIRQKLADWNVMVAGGAMYAPKYEGSDEFEVVPIPMVSATIGRFTISPGGIDVDVWESSGFKVTVKGGYDLGGGRKEKDSIHLKGLGDIKGGALLGAQISYETGPLEFYASVDKTFGGSDGLQAVVGANISHNYNNFLFAAGASATFADDKYMQTYFGVTALQSARSGLSRYEAGAGLKRFDIEASVTYMATENWLVRGQVGVGFLTGDAKNSPITRKDTQPSGMLLVGYRF